MDRDPDSNVPMFAAPQDFADRILIPQVVGHDVGLLLCGVSIPLCARYFLSPAYQSSTTMEKVFVSLVTLCYSVSTVLMMVRTGWAAVLQHRDRAFFFRITVIDVMFDFACMSTVILTQIFLARRAYVFARRAAESAFLQTLRSRMMPRAILIGATLSIAATCVGFFVYIALIAKKHFTTNPTNRLELRGSLATLVSPAVTDVIVSASLAWHWFAYLNHEGDLLGRRAGTESVLRRLIAFTLATALYTTLTAIVAAAVMLATSQLIAGPSNTTWALFSQLLAPLYFVTLVTTLNLRDSLRDNQNPTSQQITLPTMGRNATTRSREEQGSGEACKLDVQLASGGFVIKSSDFAAV